MARGYPDWEGGKSRVYSGADWAAIEGIDKNFYAGNLLAGWADSAIETYNVPSGKALYICGVACLIVPLLVADVDATIRCWFKLEEGITGTYRLQESSYGGNSIVLPKPLVWIGDEQFKATIFSMSNVTVAITLNAWGYEI